MQSPPRHPSASDLASAHLMLAEFESHEDQAALFGALLSEPQLLAWNRETLPAIGGGPHRAIHGDVVSRAILGGLHHVYERAA